jgi:plasmid maintenance system antidote protein VapI
MKTTQDLRDALNACKGTGRWARIAEHAKCDYNNLTRIARGDSALSLDFAVKLFAAIDATAEPEAKPAQEAA